jgi:hypothetical protein
MAVCLTSCRYYDAAGQFSVLVHVSIVWYINIVDGTYTCKPSSMCQLMREMYLGRYIDVDVEKGRMSLDAIRVCFNQ